MLSFNTLLIVLVVFAVVDFLYVHFAQRVGSPDSIFGAIMRFFVDVNNKAKAFINSIFGEIEKNWLEAVILVVLYFLVFGTDPVLFVRVLIGYLVLRLILDAFGKNG